MFSFFHRYKRRDGRMKTRCEKKNTIKAEFSGLFTKKKKTERLEMIFCDVHCCSEKLEDATDEVAFGVQTCTVLDGFSFLFFFSFDPYGMVFTFYVFFFLSSL